MQKLWFLIFFISIQSFADSRIMPEQTETQLFPGGALYFGLFDENTQFRLKTRYEGTGAGVSLGFSQHIHDMWNGILIVGFSNWEAQETYVGDEPPQSHIAPLTLSSIVEAAPSPVTLLGSWSASFRPLLFGGLGYVQFFRDQAVPTSRSKKESSEMTFTYGVGIKYALPANMALRIAADRWRSIRTFNYSLTQIHLGILLGDTAGW